MQSIAIDQKKIDQLFHQYYDSKVTDFEMF